MPAKKNPYYYFVIHFREDKKKKFNITYKSFSEASNAAGPVWRLMPREERDKFALSNLPSSLVNNLDQTMEKKYTSQGKPIDELDKQERNQRRNVKYMTKYIETFIANAVETNSLAKVEIFFVHANFYCQLKSGYHHHAEFAISKFNLLDGVLDTFHTFINPGPLPSGTTSVAQQKSEKEHHIPLPGKTRDCVPITDDYSTLFHRVRKFAEKATDENGKCVMYTLVDTLQQTENFLFQIYEAAAMPKSFADYFGVFDLHDFFFNMGKACRMEGRQLRYETPSVPKFITDKDEFDSWSSIACDFHVKEDAAPYCSKSIVTRWAYYMCKDSCGFLNIQLQRSTHYPKELPLIDETPTTNAWIKPKQSLSEPAQNEPARGERSSNTSSSSSFDSKSNQMAWRKPPPVLEEAHPVTKTHGPSRNTSANRPAVPIGAWGKPLVMKGGREQRFNAPQLSHNNDRDFPSLGGRNRSAARNKTMSRGGKSTTVPRGNNFNSVVRLHELSDDEEIQNPNVPHNDLDYAGLKGPRDNDSDFSIEDIDKVLNLSVGGDLDEVVGGNNGFIRGGGKDEESFAEVRQRLNPMPSNAWPTNTNIGHLSQQNKRIAAKFSTPLEHSYKEKN